MKLTLKIWVLHHLRVSLNSVCVTAKLLKFSSAFWILPSFSNVWINKECAKYKIQLQTFSFFTSLHTYSVILQHTAYFATKIEWCPKLSRIILIFIILELLTGIRDQKLHSLIVLWFISCFMFCHHHIISPRSVVPVNKLHSWPVVENCNCSRNHDKCGEAGWGSAWYLSACERWDHMPSAQWRLHQEMAEVELLSALMTTRIRWWSPKVPHAHGWQSTADQMLQSWLQWGGKAHPFLTATGSPSPNFASSLVMANL